MDIDGEVVHLDLPRSLTFWDDSVGDVKGCKNIKIST